MRFQIIGDSSLDTNDELDRILMVKKAPLHIEVGGQSFRDDENLDIGRLIAAIASYKGASQSAAPSPYDFSSRVSGEGEGVFFITLSAGLSASYNNASLACEDVAEQYPHLKAHAIDSRSASTGQTAIALKLRELEAEGASFEEAVKAIEAFRDDLATFFVLDNIDTLLKNGRMSRIQGMLATFLHIKPIFFATDEGQIGLYEKTRTSSKALLKLAEIVAGHRKDPEARTLIVSHANAEGRARTLVERIASLASFKAIHVVAMGGLSTFYANEGGLICAL